MFKSKNTELKFQSTALKTIVIPHQENTNVSCVLPIKKNFLGETLVQVSIVTTSTPVAHCRGGFLGIRGCCYPFP